MKETEIIDIPPLFICPISLELFKDPVTLCTGQTYDRSSIENWLAAGNVTCPVTMQKLDDLSLVPNHTLRHLIDQWLQESCQSRVVSQSDYGHNNCSIAALKHGLSSPEFVFKDKLQMLETISILSKELPWKNSLLIQLDLLTIVLEQVFGYPGATALCSEQGMRFTEEALACALNLLPFSEIRCLNFLKEESRLGNLLTLFGQGSLKIKRCVCNLMEVISSSLETQQLCSILGKSGKLLEQVINLLQQETEASEAGIKAISALSSLESNREALVREATVQGLIEYMVNAEKHKMNMASNVLETIERLLTMESAKLAVLNHPDGVRVLVKMVFRVSEHEGSESAVNCLLALCSDSVYAREDAICAGVMTQLLLLLQSQFDGGTKSRARMLLKLLKSVWAEGSKQASTKI